MSYRSWDQCWQCGTALQPGEVWKATLTTTHVRGPRLRASRQERVSLCEHCAAKLNARRRLQRAALAAGVIVIILIIALLRAS